VKDKSTEGVDVTFYRRPRVFISYRHEYARGTPDAAEANQSHRDWVRRFAGDLARWNIDVIFDGRLQNLFQPHVKADPEVVPFLAEVSVLCIHVAHVFITITTPAYLESICVLPDEKGIKKGRGTAFREWQIGIEHIQNGQCELLSIVRGGLPRGSEFVHFLFDRRIAWDFGQRVSYDDQVELLCDRLHLGWQVERPIIDLPFVEWISAYVTWCQDDDPHRSTIEIDTWESDFQRPNRFLEHIEALRARGAMPSSVEGTGRHDLDRWRQPDVDVLDLRHASPLARGLSDGLMARLLKRLKGHRR